MTVAYGNRDTTSGRVCRDRQLCFVRGLKRWWRMGLRWGSMRAGGMMSVMPSGARVRFHSPWWMRWWWKLHSRHPLSMSVASAAAPRDAVVCFGPGGGSFAAGEDAALVADGHRDALVAVEQTSASCRGPGCGSHPRGPWAGGRRCTPTGGSHRWRWRRRCRGWLPRPRSRSLVSSTVTTMDAFATPWWGCPSAGRCSMSSQNACPSRLPYGQVTEGRLRQRRVCRRVDRSCTGAHRCRWRRVGVRPVRRGVS